MSIFSIYFSPTGGVKKVMTTLEEEFKAALTQDSSKDTAQKEDTGSKLITIDLLKPDTDYASYHFTAKDVCLVGVPSFGGRVPDVVIERLKKMSANKAKAVAVVVYGNRHYDDTLLELKDVLEGIGFTVIAGITANAKHSIFKQYATLRPDAEDKTELKTFAGEILCKLYSLRNAAGIGVADSANADGSADGSADDSADGSADDSADGSSNTCAGDSITVPGNRPYREYPGHPLKPITNDYCVLCRACVKKCPTEASPQDAPDTTIAEKCITCMRCIAACPFDARSLDKAAVAAAAEKMAPAFEGRKPNELFI